MKLLIYGANGWIGRQFTNFLDQQSIITYTKSLQRADDIPAVTAELEDGKYSHVLCLIGRTSGVYKGKHINTIDFLEHPGNLTLNVRDNLFAPIALAVLCEKFGIHLTYLGTGCIFEYDDIHTSIECGWTEEDTPTFFGSAYSTVKGYTDRLMHLFNVLNLRIRMPISRESNARNFITKITKYEKICSIPNSMTVLSDFFPVWLDLMTREKVGTYNCTNPGVITHNEILAMYRDIVDPSFTWKNFTIEEQDLILDAKRSNNHLDTRKLEKEYPSILNIHTAVKRILEEWRQDGNAN